MELNDFFKISQLEASRLVEAMYNSYCSLTLPSYWCFLLTPRVGRPHSATSSPSHPLISLVIICLLWSPGHSLPGMCSWQLGNDLVFIVFPQVVRELGPMFLNSQYEAQGPTLTSMYVCWLWYHMISWLAHLPCPSLCVFHSYPLPLHIQNMFPYSEGREGPALTRLHLPDRILRSRGSKDWSSVTLDRSLSAGRRMQPCRQTVSKN